MLNVARSLTASIALASLAGCADSYGPEDFYAIWGGEGAQLLISETRARFETSCWSGDLEVPIDVAGRELIASGNLSWHGGAGGTETRGVVIIGRKDDDILHLTVEGSMNIGPYTLRRNREANIPGCP